MSPRAHGRSAPPGRRNTQRLPGPVFRRRSLPYSHSAWQQRRPQPLQATRRVLDPLRQVRDLVGREPFLRWHLEVVAVLDSLDQQAFFSGMTGDDGRAGIAPLEQAVAVIDGLALGVGVGGVTVVTIVDQQGRTLFSKNSTAAASARCILFAFGIVAARDKDGEKRESVGLKVISLGSDSIVRRLKHRRPPLPIRSLAGVQIPMAIPVRS